MQNLDKRLVTLVDAELLKDLQARAAETDTPVAALTRRFIRLGLYADQVQPRIEKRA